MVLDIDTIVKERVIDTINNVIRVKSVTPLENSRQTVVFCDSKYLRLFGSFFTSDNVFEFGVLMYNSEGSVTVAVPEGVEIQRGNEFILRIPYYFKGTPMAVNMEWKKFSSYEGVKLPLIWLLQPTNEVFRERNTVERVSDIKFFLLCGADFTNDFTDDFRRKNVQPLFELAKCITESVNRNSMYFNKLVDHRTRDFSKFGTEEKTGIVKSIIDSNLSGVELTFSLEVLKKNCKC